MRPPLGLTLPCRVLKVHDGDTMTVEVRIVANVRLCGDGKRECWAPELKEPGGIEARDYLVGYALGNSGRLHIPIGDNASNISALLTMGRVLGDVWIAGDQESISEWMVRNRFASTKKGGKLGE
jgi:endonuclease YncB( thermonuclease family)